MSFYLLVDSINSVAISWLYICAISLKASLDVSSTDISTIVPGIYSGSAFSGTAWSEQFEGLLM
jgi:hypothetical protein